MHRFMNSCEHTLLNNRIKDQRFLISERNADRKNSELWVALPALPALVISLRVSSEQ